MHTLYSVALKGVLVTILLINEHVLIGFKFRLWFDFGIVEYNYA